MIDDGMALPLNEALALEAGRARTFNDTISADAIESLRAGVFVSNRR